MKVQHLLRHILFRSILWNRPRNKNCSCIHRTLQQLQTLSIQRQLLAEMSEHCHLNCCVSRSSLGLKRISKMPGLEPGTSRLSMLYIRTGPSGSSRLTVVKFKFKKINPFYNLILPTTAALSVGHRIDPSRSFISTGFKQP